MANLRLTLLGAPRLELDGQPVIMDTRKAIALLAYLSMTGGAYTREALSSFFWPDYDPSSARAALRRTLSVLRKGVGEGILETDWENIRLVPGAPLWTDAQEFTRLLEDGQAGGPAGLALFEQAAELYGGDFMAGFSLRDSPDFNDWQFFESEGYRRRLTRVLQALALGRAAVGDFPHAVQHARRWLALDVLNEEAHRQLMQLYAWTGERNAALRQYRECTRILDEELGVAPMEETSQLYTDILENRIQPSPAAPALVQAGLAARPLTEPQPAAPEEPAALVGRAAELRLLREAYAQLASDGSFCALVGEPGIGKTTLAEVFLAECRVGGAVVLSGRCYEGEDNLAYAPLIEALHGGLSRPETLNRVRALPGHALAEAARLIPELASPARESSLGSTAEGPAAQGRFFDSLRQVIERLTAVGPPGVLFLDDLQWADSASLELLAYLVRRLRGLRLFILATWRETGLPAGHPLRRLVYDLQRAGSGQVLSLARFSQAEVEALARANLGAGALPADFTRRLLAETEGLPFFVVEYLKSAALSGAQTSGEIPAPESWEIPHSVRDLLHARLEKIGETGSQLLSAAAVIGRSFDFETLRGASGRSELETLAGLEELLAQGLVIERQEAAPQGGIRYDFSYDPLRGLVYEETSLTRRRLLHRRVADTLLAQAGRAAQPGPLAAQIARHLAAAGQEHQAAEQYALAGQAAQSVYANSEALAHYRAALALGHPDPARLHEALGELLTLAGDYPGAIRSYQTAAARAPEADTPRLEHRLGEVYNRRGNWELAVQHYQAALAGYQAAGAGAARAWLSADWARTEHQRGRPAEALELARRALGLAESAEDPRALSQALNTLGILDRARADWPEAISHLSRSLEIARQHQDLAFQTAALNNLALVYGECGDEPRAIDLVREALDLCARQGDRHREAALLNHLADLYHNSGQPEQAIEHLTRAVKIFAEIGGEADQLSPEVWKLTEW